MWSIGKWRHYFEGRHLIVQTDHSSLRHLPNQPSVNRRIWKWVSVLQGYDLEIRHIPGKVNPADTLTRQAWLGDAEYVSRVKDADQEMVDMIKVKESASDLDIQRKLNELYSTEELRDKRAQVQDQVLEREVHAILSVAESSVQLDEGFKRDLLQRVQEDSEYTDIM